MNKLSRKLFLVLALIFITAGNSFANSDVVAVLKPQTPEEGKVTLSAVSIAQAFASVTGAEVKETYEELSNLENGIFTLLHSDKMDAEEFTEELKNNPDVLAAMPNYPVKVAAIPNDSNFSQANCWGMYAVNAVQAWDKNTGSNNLYVAVIDSGIDYTNPDIAPNYNETYSSQFSSLKDTNGHGTHVAGIIGAKGNNGIGLAGVNWDVGLISVNALPGGSGTISDVIRGLNFVTHLVNNGVNIRAVNLSIETAYNIKPTPENLSQEPMWLAFKALDSTNKVVMVVASGNHSVNIGEYNSSLGGYVYPASYKGTLDNFITVGAFDQNLKLASFSNKGSDVLAPGVYILSTYKQSNTDTTAVSTKILRGTSMSAPFISGAAALLASIDPNLTAYQIKSVLVNGNAKSISTAASIEKIFDLSQSISYYESNKNEILASSPSSNSDGNETQQAQSDSNSSDSGGNSGGGGCNGLMLGIFAAVIFLPLAKKLKH